MDQEIEKKFNEAVEGLNAKAEGIKELINAKADAKEIEAVKSELKNELKTVLEGAKAQGVELEKLKKAMESGEGQKMTFTGAMIKALKENEAKLKELGGSSQARFTLEVKAQQTAGDITSGSDFADMESGVGQLAKRKTFIKSLFTAINTNKETIKFNDQETVVRDAKNVASVAASTHLSKITWQVRKIDIKKVRDFVDVSLDMMDDYDYVEGEIRELVYSDVALKVDEQLLLGSGTGDELNSISAVASTFAAGVYAAKVKTPTVVDLVTVCGGLIADAGLNNKFMANVALMNPSDALLLKLEKNANGNYLLPNLITATGANIGAIEIMANPLVPANQMFVMDTTKGRIYQRKANAVEFGYENATNFEKELVTIKAYERLNFRVRNVDANAFLHVPDIAAALVAITAA